MTSGETLAARRRELLRRRLAEGPGHSGGATRIGPRADPDRAPLSFAQRRMWSHQQLHPESSAYNMGVLIEFTGPVEERALVEAFRVLVQRHEILRTTYSLGPDGEPYQVIHPELAPSVRTVELVDLPATEEARRARELAQARTAEPFDLASDPPLRLLVIRRGPERLSVAVTAPHIVWDGGCLDVLSAEVSRYYQDLRAGIRPHPEPPSVQYADFAEYEQRRWSEPDPEREAQAAFWARALDPLPNRLPLPVDRPFDLRSGEEAAQVNRHLPGACAAGLRRLATDLGTTPFAVFVACYGLLLRRWTGSADIPMGTMVMNRHHPGTEELIGCFGNTVVLRLLLDGDPTFTEVARQAHQVCSAAVAHQDHPFEEVVKLAERLRPHREAGRPFLFDTLALFLTQDIGGPQLPGVTTRWTHIFPGTTPFALTFQAFLNDEGLDVEATYRVDLFDTGTVRRMVADLERIILLAAEEPRRRSSTIAAPTEGERERLLALGSAQPEQPAPKPLPLALRDRVARHPERTALVCGGTELSYAELDRRANRLAHRLRGLGVAPEDVVAVVLPRSPDMVVALLAVWKCGAAYLPADPTHPAARIAALLADGAPRAVVTTSALPGEALPPGGVPTVTLDDPDPQTHPDTDPGVTLPALAAAYIGYTSGSTGQPKAVVGTHDALAHRVAWAARHWPSGPGGARLAKSPLTFIDGSTEILEALAAGERVVLADDRAATDATELAALIRRHRIAHLMAVPGLLEALSRVAPETLAGMDRVISTGEALSALAARALLRAAPRTPLANSYGCSETTGDVTAGPVTVETLDTGQAPAGTPLPGTRCHLLDDRLVPVPPGVVAELYVGGPQLTRGYRGQPALTASRFVADPFGAPGERLYRTGDLARWTAAGELELIGRVDHQVKIRGNRVEPGEVAAALREEEGIAEAVAIARPGPAGTLQLVAYVTPARGDTAGMDPAALRERLAARLPDYLVPVAVVPLEDLPRLPNGKLDRSALPAPAQAPAARSRGPRDEREATLCALLAELLGTDTVGAEDDFFALGGDSLLAITFAGRARARGLDFAASDVFEHPTAARLAARLAPAPPARTPGSSRSAPVDGATPLPLPATAHRLRADGIPVAGYVAWYAWQPQTEITPDALGAVLRTLTDRHPTLRTMVDTTRPKLWRAWTAPSGAAAVPIVVEGADVAAAVTSAAERLDIATGQTLAAGLVAAAGAAPARAVLVAHALAADGGSLPLLAAETEALLSGRAPARPPLGGPPEPDPDTIAAWREALAAGPDTAWWRAPATSPPGAGRERIRTELAGHADPLRVAAAFLAAARDHSGGGTLLADHEPVPPPGVVGPLAAAPVAARAGEDIAGLAARLAAAAPTAPAYLPFRYATREGARLLGEPGTPGVLLRSGATAGPERARGGEGHYRIAAAYDVGARGVVLEISAAGAPGAGELLDRWAAALTDG